MGKTKQKSTKKKDILDEKNEIKDKDMADETTLLPLFLEDSSIRFFILPQAPNWSSQVRVSIRLSFLFSLRATIFFTGAGSPIEMLFLS